MKSFKLNHVVLSGHSKFTSDISEVAEQDLINVTAWAQKALDADMEYEIDLKSVPTFIHQNNKYKAILVNEWGTLNCIIFNDDLSKPLVTFQVTNDEKFDESKWNLMVSKYGNVANHTKPPLPWCATVFHPGFDEDPTIADWSAIFEKELAFAWVTQTIPNVDVFAKYSN